MIYAKSDYYVIVNDTIISYFGKAETVNVPSSADGIRIRRIGAGAFMKNRYLKKVKIEEGIKEIGEKAFSECENLCEVWLPESITEVDDTAFKGTDKLKTVNCYVKVTCDEFANIMEGGIRLTDDRVLLDPVLLGAKNERLIRTFMRAAVDGIFKARNDMNILFCMEREGTDEERRITRSYVFRDYAKNYDHENEMLLRDQSGSFTDKIANNVALIRIKHDEEKDDIMAICFEHHMSELEETAQVLYIKQGSADDNGVYLNLDIRSGIWYFHNGFKTVINGKTFYIRYAEVFARGDERPYVRVDTTPGVFDKNGPVTDNETVYDIESMNRFLCNLV